MPFVPFQGQESFHQWYNVAPSFEVRNMPFKFLFRTNEYSIAQSRKIVVDDYKHLVEDISKSPVMRNSTAPLTSGPRLLVSRRRKNPDSELDWIITNFDANHDRNGRRKR